MQDRKCARLLKVYFSFIYSPLQVAQVLQSKRELEQDWNGTSAVRIAPCVPVFIYGGCVPKCGCTQGCKLLKVEFLQHRRSLREAKCHLAAQFCFSNTSQKKKKNPKRQSKATPPFLSTKFPSCWVLGCVAEQCWGSVMGGNLRPDPEQSPRCGRGGRNAGSFSSCSLLEHRAGRIWQLPVLPFDDKVQRSAVLHRGRI